MMKILKDQRSRSLNQDDSNVEIQFYLNYNRPDFIITKRLLTC